MLICWKRASLRRIVIWLHPAIVPIVYANIKIVRRRRRSMNYTLDTHTRRSAHTHTGHDTVLFAWVHVCDRFADRCVLKKANKGTSIQYNLLYRFHNTSCMQFINTFWFGRALCVYVCNVCASHTLVACGSRCADRTGPITCVDVACGKKGAVRTKNARNWDRCAAACARRSAVHSRW